MIIKTFELQKLKATKAQKFLFYGENEGYKDQIINEYFLKKFKNSTNRYDENEVLNNYDSFISNLLNKSFFEENKLIIISRCSEKIFYLIEEIITKNIQEITLIINSGPLDKKSKIRTLFEKNKDTVSIPFYADDKKTLSILAYNFFKNKKILVSQETINLLVERCRGRRKSLDTELTKIENFAKKFDVLVFIVAHPTKMYKDKDGQIEEPNMYNIKGGGEWYDASYHGILVHRDYDAKTVKAKVLKVKFQNLGENGAECHFKWEPNSGSFIPHVIDQIKEEPMPWE